MEQARECLLPTPSVRPTRPSRESALPYLDTLVLDAVAVLRLNSTINTLQPAVPLADPERSLGDVRHARSSEFPELLDSESNCSAPEWSQKDSALTRAGTSHRESVRQDVCPKKFDFFSAGVFLMSVDTSATVHPSAYLAQGVHGCCYLIKSSTGATTPVSALLEGSELMSRILGIGADALEAVVQGRRFVRHRESSVTFPARSAPNC
jgi:hypothetical protein